MAGGSVASASSMNLLEMQKLRPHLGATETNTQGGGGGSTNWGGPRAAPLGGFCGTCRPTPARNQQGYFRRSSPESLPPTGRHITITHQRQATWHQTKPHLAPNPSSPQTQSSAHSAKSNHTLHQIQAHSAPNPTTLSTKSNHTQHQIQPHQAPNPGSLVLDTLCA